MISVIGAGPAGSFYASQEKHDDVHLFEEHKVVGKPFSCSGVLTNSISKIVKIPDELIISRIKQFKIVAPNKKAIYVPLKHPNLIIDRTKFDRWLFDKAIDNGATSHLNEKFLGYKKENNAYKIKTSKSTYDTNMIVGADGPFSQVAKSAKIFKERKSITGLQSRCKYKNLEEGTTTIFLDKGDFAWVIPEDDKIARVGVLGKPSKRLWKDYMNLIGKRKIIQNISGAIPVFDPKQQLRKGNIFLIGDAASQLKATTHGGLVFGLQAAKYLANNKNTYEKNFKHLNKELWISLKMRQLMNVMTTKQKNALITIFSKKQNKDVLSTHDRDYPSKFLFKLVLREPRLVSLGVSLLKNSIFKPKKL